MTEPATYIIGESDRYTVFKHKDGDHAGYCRIIAQSLATELIYVEGKLKGDDSLWLTPRLVAGPVGDLSHCLEIWLRETVHLSPEGAARWVPWFIDILAKGRAL